MPGREPNMEDAPYRIFRAPKNKKKKETYEQLELPIKLAKGKDKFKNDPLTSPNAS